MGRRRKAEDAEETFCRRPRCIGALLVGTKHDFAGFYNLIKRSQGGSLEHVTAATHT